MAWIINVFAAYGAPLVVLAVFCLVLFGCDDKFRGPFYRLMQMSIVIDLLCYFNTWGDKILNTPEFAKILHPLYLKSKWFFIIHTFCGHLFFHMQSGCFLILCLFRYSVLKSQNAMSNWQKYYPLAFLLLLALSAIITIPFALINGLDVISFDETTGEPHRDVSGWKTFVLFMYLESLTYLVVTAYIWHRTTLAVSFLLPAETATTKKFNCQMTKILLCDLLVHFCVLGWDILTHTRLVPLEFRMLTLFGVSDLMSLSRPVILLFMDSHLKKKLASWRNTIKQAFLFIVVSLPDTSSTYEVNFVH